VNSLIVATVMLAGSHVPVSVPTQDICTITLQDCKIACETDYALDVQLDSEHMDMAVSQFEACNVECDRQHGMCSQVSR